MRMEAFDRFDADDTFMLRLVREHRRARDVADRVDAGDTGLAFTVDNNDAALGFYAEFFQPKVFDIFDHTDGRDHAVEFSGVRLTLAVVDGRDNTVALFIELRNLGVREYLDALFLKPLAREASDLGIFHGKDLRENLDDGHVGAHRVEEGGEFDADCAGADNQQRLRHLFRDHGFKISPNQLLVGFQTRQHARSGTGCKDDVLGLIRALT